MRNDYYTQIIGLIKELKQAFPKYNLGRHLSTALDGNADVWGMPDKELLHLLHKYKIELELDIPHSNDQEIDDIIKNGLNLHTMFEEEEYNGEEY
jgi:hypothetical protein